MPLDADLLLRQGILVPRTALQISFSRSGGPGGQNVNKVSTKAELRLRLEDVPGLTEEQRAMIRGRFPSYFTKDGELLLTSQVSRSQAQNLDDCVARLRSILETGLMQPKRRRPTRPTFASKLRRIEDKRHRSGIRKDRKVGGDGE